MTGKLVALFAAVAATASLVSCGGGGGYASTAPVSPTPPPPGTLRGTLMGTENVSAKSTAEIDAFGDDGSKGPIAPGETASCAASFRQINYATVNPQGVTVTASAGLLVPVGSAACTQARPLLSFQHGTSDTNTFEGANADGTLSQTLAKYFVSHGYVVVVPDYLGYGASIGHYHPYVVAEAEATTVIDAVRAARNWFASADGAASGASLSGQLFLSGTSEGGYVTMATHRTMERDFPTEFPITADVPISGPYDLDTEVMSSLLYADQDKDEEAGATAFLLSGLQNSYGDVWTTPSEVFQSPWDQTAPTLFPSAVYASDQDALEACQIPFNITTAPSRPIGDCSRNPLLQPTFVTDYVNAVPGTAGGIARQHVEDNDLLQGWANGGGNLAPMTVCYGSPDTTAMANALAAQSYFGIEAVDVQTTGPDFITTWMTYVTANPGNLQYHGGIEAPGCTAYARYVIFDSYVPAVP
jgi:alpha/beta superfamily hydrolase